jgi:hypothetical protein
MKTKPRALLFLLLSTLQLTLNACGEPEIFDQLESTTGCNQNDTPPDPDLEGKWRLDEVVCFNETLDEVTIIAMFESTTATIEAKGSCSISVLDDGYCGAVIGGSFSVPEESVITVSGATVLDLTDGSDSCYFYDYLEGSDGYSAYDLVDNWLEVEYSREQTFPEYSRLYIKAEDTSWVLLENPGFTPSAGGYCFSSYSRSSSSEDARKDMNKRQVMLNQAKGKIALRKILRESP